VQGKVKADFVLDLPPAEPENNLTAAVNPSSSSRGGAVGAVEKTNGASNITAQGVEEPEATGPFDAFSEKPPVYDPYTSSGAGFRGGFIPTVPPPRRM
jgi:hypothetical protein